MDFYTAECLFTLGQLLRDDMPEAAQEGLAQGLESPSLAVLAGLTPAELYRARELFARALQELGRPPIPQPLATRQRAVAYARAIVAGAIPPVSGAAALWWLWDDINDPAVRDDLVGFLEDWDAWELAPPPQRGAVERRIVERAERFAKRWDAAVAPGK